MRFLALTQTAWLGPMVSVLIFINCWDIIKTDIEEACMDFFSGTPMPRSFTGTSLAFIPKVESPRYWSEFRPISLCNVSNKIFTKILSNRLSALLPKIIIPS